MRIRITNLRNEYAILLLPEHIVELVAALTEIEYMEKPKLLFFAHAIMCVSNEQCQMSEKQKMTACRHFFVFFLFDRAVPGAGGTCLARTEVERRCLSVQWHCGRKLKVN